MWLGNSTSCNKVAKAAIDAKPEPEAKLEDTSRTGWMANNVTSLYTTSWGHGREEQTESQSEVSTHAYSGRKLSATVSTDCPAKRLGA